MTYSAYRPARTRAPPRNFLMDPRINREDPLSFRTAKIDAVLTPVIGSQ